jgi:large subunit ribosomal protein L7A
LGHKEIGRQGRRGAFYENIQNFYRKFVDISGKRRIIISRMDTKNFEQKKGQNVLSEVSRRKMVVGAKQMKKALCSGRATWVILAENADPAITEPLEQMCQQYHISCAWVPNMVDLGKACGIEVGTAAAAALD